MVWLFIRNRSHSYGASPSLTAARQAGT